MKNNKLQTIKRVFLSTLDSSSYSSYMITNELYENQKPPFYTLKISRQKCELTEVKNTLENNYIFNLETNQFTVNGKTSDETFHQEFSAKVDKIANDLIINSAKMFKLDGEKK